MINFVKINDDRIINISAVCSIERYACENPKYNEWVEFYNSLMQDVSEQYIKQHADELDFINKNESELVDILYNKFDKIIHKNVEKEMGPRPDPYMNMYKIIMFGGYVIEINEDEYNILISNMNNN